jgi:hypothetical protein
VPTVRELITRIAFRVERGRLQAAGVAVGTVKKQMRATARQARQLTGNINAMAVGAKVMVTAFFASRIFAFLTTGFSNSADAAAKFAKSTGVSVETYQALGHAVQLSGGDVADLQKGLQQLGKRALEVTQGNKTLKKQFGALGLEVTDASGKLKNQDQLLFEIADRFKAMEDGSKKTGLAMQLLGRSGAKLIPLFNEGSEGIRKMTAEAKRLGIVLTKEQAAIAEQFNDELLRSKSVLIGVRNQIAVRLLPVITKNLEKFRAWATESDNLQRALGRLKAAAIAAAIALAAIKITKLGVAFAAALPAIKVGVTLLWGLARAAAAAAGPLLIPIALLALLVLAIEDLVGFATGRESLIGELFGDTAEGQEVKDLLVEIGRTFKGIGKAFAEVRVELFKSFKGLFKALGRIVLALLPILLRVTILLLRIISWVAKIVAGAVEKIAGALIWLMDKLAPVGDAFSWLGRKGEEAAKAISNAFVWVADRINDAYQWLGDNLAFIWTGLKELAIETGEAIAAPFLWAWKQIKAGWDTAVGGIIKAINWVVDKILWATNAMAALTGQQKAAGGIAAGVATAAAVGGGTVNAQQNVQVTLGSLGLTVQGTAAMTPEQLEEASRRAIRQGLNDWASDVINARRPSPEGAAP